MNKYTSFVRLLISIASLGAVSSLYSLSTTTNATATAFPLTPPVSGPISGPNTPPVKPIKPVITTPQIHPAKINKPYKANLKASTFQVMYPLNVNIIGLPQNLSYICNTKANTTKQIVTCQVNGTPTQKGIYSIQVVAADGAGQTTQDYQLSVK
jgi:hypothetical protein